MEEKFNCEKCGACCKAVGCSLITKNNTCSIYETRPDICSVSKGYKRVQHTMSLDNWYKLNKSCCYILRDYVKHKGKGLGTWSQ